MSLHLPTFIPNREFLFAISIRGTLSMYTNIFRVDVKRSVLDPFSESQWQDKEGAKIKHRKFYLNLRKNFFTVRATEHWALTAQRDWGASISGNIQNPLGHNPVQPALSESVLAGSWSRWSPEVPSNPNGSVILWIILAYAKALVLLSDTSFCLQLLLATAVSGSAHLAGTCSSSSILKDSWVCFTGGLAWPSKESSLTPWPCDGCCMSDVKS